MACPLNRTFTVRWRPWAPAIRLAGPHGADSWRSLSRPSVNRRRVLTLAAPNGTLDAAAAAEVGASSPSLKSNSAERAQEVVGLLEQLAGAGHLPAEQLEAAVQLVPQLVAGLSSTGNYAASLLHLVRMSRGVSRSFQGCAEAVAAVGGEASRTAVMYLTRRMIAKWKGSKELQDLLPPPGRAACVVLGQLAVQGLFPPEQLADAEVLAADIGWAWEGKRAPLAAALLVAFSQAGGKRLSTKQAAAGVRASGAAVSEQQVEHALDACMAVWQESPVWQRVLGPPVDKWILREREVERILLRLQAAGHLQASQLDTARQLLPSLRGFNGKVELVTAAFLVLLARGDRNELSLSKAVSMLDDIGISSNHGVWSVVIRLEQRCQAMPLWQELLGPAACGSAAVRVSSRLEAALQQLAGQGILPEQQLDLALRVFASLDVQQLLHRHLKPGVLASSLLVVVATARGSLITPAVAVEAARRAGLEVSVGAVVNQLPRLLCYWQGSAEWARLLGPAPQQPPSQWSAHGMLHRQRGIDQAELQQLLQRVCELSQVPSDKVEALAGLAAEALLRSPSGAVSLGTAVAALLVLLARVHGVQLTPPQAALAAAEAGGETSLSVHSVRNRVAKLRTLWQSSEAWQQRLGPAPPRQRGIDQAELQPLLQQLCEAGQVPSDKVEALAGLVAQAELSTTRPASVSAVAAALLVLLARSHGMALTLAQALGVAAEAGGKQSPSLTAVWAMTRKLEGHWQSSEAWQQLLGPAPPRQHGPDQAEIQQLLQQLCKVGQVPSDKVEVLAGLAQPELSTTCPPSASIVATALLVLLARSHGIKLSQAQAAQVAAGAGAKHPSQSAVLSMTRKFEATWQSSEAWQQLLGPALPRQRGIDPAELQPVLQQLCEVGQVPSDKVEALAGLAARAELTTTRPVSIVATALLVLLARSHGVQLSQAQAVRVAAEAGGEQSPSQAGVSTMEGTFEAHWQSSEAWQQLLGPAPPRQRGSGQAEIQQLLQQLCKVGQVPSDKVEALAGLAAKAQLSSKGPASVSTVAAALLVLLARSHGIKLTLDRAAQAVAEASGNKSPSVAAVWEKARVCTAHWQESAYWQEVLGPCT